MTTEISRTQFDTAIDRFVELAQEFINAEYKKAYGDAVAPPVLGKSAPGPNFVRLHVTRPGSTAQSAWAFVEISTGLIYKCAGWKKPAKHSRGWIFNANPLDGMTMYGPEYLR